jgi:RNA polymerase sigma-70 factor, ECF subfamily
MADPSEMLVRAAREGSEEAFVSLYRTYADRVYRFCMARVGRAADAEDLLQVTFLRVVEALPRYEQRGLPFGAWLFRIARNATIDHQRQQRQRSREESLSLEEDSPRVAREAASRVETASLVAERDALLGAMANLTPDQREVIQLRFFADLTAHDAGLLLGRNEAAVRVLQARALAALRRQLEAGGVRTPALGLVGT